MQRPTPARAATARGDARTRPQSIQDLIGLGYLPLLYRRKGRRELGDRTDEQLTNGCLPEERLGGLGRLLAQALDNIFHGFIARDLFPDAQLPGHRAVDRLHDLEQRSLLGVVLEQEPPPAVRFRCRAPETGRAAGESSAGTPPGSRMLLRSRDLARGRAADAWPRVRLRTQRMQTLYLIASLHHPLGLPRSPAAILTPHHSRSTARINCPCQRHVPTGPTRGSHPKPSRQRRPPAAGPAGRARVAIACAGPSPGTRPGLRRGGTA